ncbi:MAG: NAD(P)/FAD-dependent oxidoreductase [Burkholderiaceae bacterium]
MQHFDAVIVGAGAAGLFCAGVAAQRGLNVLLIDHSEKVAEKIRISGGGRSNFTNRDLDVRAPQRHFISDNPHFCRSALSRYTPQDFVALVQRHGIPFHEKHKGQLFCDRSAEDLIAMLLRECDAGAAGGRVTRWQPCTVKNVVFCASSALQLGVSSYELETSQGRVSTPALVVATGGLSIPKIGATDFGFRLAKQFGLALVPTRPALVPLTFDEAQWQPLVALAGLSLEATLAVGEKKQKTEFLEDLLFTHRGLSGPGVLQISSYWQPGQPLTLNLAPGQPLATRLGEAKRQSRKLLANELGRLLPARLADAWCTGAVPGLDTAALARPACDVPDKALAQLADSLQQWRITPNGTEGYRKAEVTAGGVDTRELSQQSMESQKQPGLYFIGEVVDVTGWLGGYNFQWAWASAHACAQALAAKKETA